MTSSVDPATISPKGLLAALEDAGFTVHATGNGGFYARMNWPVGSPQHSATLLVPLDQTAPEYGDMVGVVLRELEKAATAGRAASHVLTAVKAASRA